MWGLQMDGPVVETFSGRIIFVRRSGQRLVLKLPVPNSDETLSWAALERFAGHGAVRLMEHTPEGAMLLERAVPGEPLTKVVLEDHDAAALSVICDVTAALHGAEPPPNIFPRVEDWALGFERYRASGDCTIPPVSIRPAIVQ